MNTHEPGGSGEATASCALNAKTPLPRPGGLAAQRAVATHEASARRRAAARHGSARRQREQAANGDAPVPRRGSPGHTPSRHAGVRGWGPGSGWDGRGLEAVPLVTAGPSFHQSMWRRGRAGWEGSWPT